MCGYVTKIIDSVFSCFWALKLTQYREKFRNQKIDLGRPKKLALPFVPNQRDVTETNGAMPR